MDAFEFQTKLNNGRIEIPAEYKDKITGTVRVIVLAQERTAVAVDMINRLLEHPLQMESFVPMNREQTHER